MFEKPIQVPPEMASIPVEIKHREVGNRQLINLKPNLPVQGSGYMDITQVLLPDTLYQISREVATFSYIDDEVVLLRITTCWDTKPLRKQHIQRPAHHPASH